MKRDQLPPLARLKKTATEAAWAAGAVLERGFRKPLDIREKPGAGLVTQVDVAAEKTALRILKRGFPSFEVLAEESAPVASTLASKKAEGRWIIDPLDGTTNYVHGFPMFCVSIAAEWRGEIVVGVIYQPILKDTYVAVLGRGARINSKKLQVSRTSRLHDSLLTTGFTYRKNEHLHREMEAFERLSGEARAVRRPGSAALDLAYTARGVFDGFWERRLSPWDVAAGALLVAEAGGKVTDFQGGKFRIDSPEILASNGILHPELQQAVSN